MKTSLQKTALFFAGLLLFTALLVLGTNFLLKLVPAGKKPPATAPRSNEADVNINLPAPGESGNRQFKIIRPDAVEPHASYTAKGFSPKLFIIQEGGSLGCLLAIVNADAAPLRIGVNPHHPRGDPGASYGLIPPGETGILDVRYSSLTEVTLHNHELPAHELDVVYGRGCQ